MNDNLNLTSQLCAQKEIFIMQHQMPVSYVQKEHGTMEISPWSLRAVLPAQSTWPPLVLEWYLQITVLCVCIAFITSLTECNECIVHYFVMWITTDMFYCVCIVDCSPGSYISDMDCLPCDFGTYQPDRHQTSCIDCGTNLNTSAVGATSRTDCQSMSHRSECSHYYRLKSKQDFS